ncbi:MAG: hypothetical protein HY720_20525 [Planctomycetes bacterium]|nr:hypothetical protein [Planctomycetota bacterium]
MDILEKVPADERSLVQLALTNQILKKEDCEEILRVLDTTRTSGLALSFMEVAQDKGYLGMRTWASMDEIQKYVKLSPSRILLDRLQAGEMDVMRIGELAVANGLLSQEELDHALAIQAETQKLGLKVPLGKVFLDRSLLLPATLQGLLYLQKRPPGPKPGGPADAPPAPIFEEDDFRIGGLVVKNGLVNRQALDRAVTVHVKLRKKGIPCRLGEVLVEEGLVSKSEVQSLLVVQKERSKKMGTLSVLTLTAEEDAALAERLVANGLVDPETLEAARTVQQELAAEGIQRQIGQILVRLGAVTMQTIRSISHLQEGARARQMSPGLGRISRKTLFLASAGAGAVVGVIALAVVAALVLGREDSKDELEMAEVGPEPAAEEGGVPEPVPVEIEIGAEGEIYLALQEAEDGLREFDPEASLQVLEGLDPESGRTLAGRIERERERAKAVLAFRGAIAKGLSDLVDREGPRPFPLGDYDDGIVQGADDRGVWVVLETETEPQQIPWGKVVRYHAVFELARAAGAVETQPGGAYEMALLVGSQEDLLVAAGRAIAGGYLSESEILRRVEERFGLGTVSPRYDPAARIVSTGDQEAPTRLAWEGWSGGGPETAEGGSPGGANAPEGGASGEPGPGGAHMPGGEPEAGTSERPHEGGARNGQTPDEEEIQEEEDPGSEELDPDPRQPGHPPKPDPGLSAAANEYLAQIYERVWIVRRLVREREYAQALTALGETFAFLDESDPSSVGLDTEKTLLERVHDPIASALKISFSGLAREIRKKMLALDVGWAKPIEEMQSVVRLVRGAEHLEELLQQTREALQRELDSLLSNTILYLVNSSPIPEPHATEVKRVLDRKLPRLRGKFFMGSYEAMPAEYRSKILGILDVRFEEFQEIHGHSKAWRGGRKLYIPKGIAIVFAFRDPDDPVSYEADLPQSRWSCNLHGFKDKGPYAMKIQDYQWYVRDPNGFRQALYAEVGARMPEWVAYQSGNWPLIVLR